MYVECKLYVVVKFAVQLVGTFETHITMKSFFFILCKHCISQNDALKLQIQIGTSFFLCIKSKVLTSV